MRMSPRNALAFLALIGVPLAGSCSPPGTPKSSAPTSLKARDAGGPELAQSADAPAQTAMASSDPPPPSQIRVVPLVLGASTNIAPAVLKVSAGISGKAGTRRVTVSRRGWPAADHYRVFLDGLAGLALGRGKSVSLTELNTPGVPLSAGQHRVTAMPIGSDGSMLWGPGLSSLEGQAGVFVASPDAVPQSDAEQQLGFDSPPVIYRPFGTINGPGQAREARLEFAIGGAGAVEAKAADSGTPAPPGIQLVIVGPKTERLALTLRRHGSYSLRGLSDGDYTLRLTVPGAARARMPERRFTVNLDAPAVDPPISLIRRR